MMDVGQVNSAEDALARHAQAINERDVAGYLASTNFPFTYQNYNGVALTVESAQGYSAAARWPWELILSTDANWQHTTFDVVEEVARSVSSVVFLVTFSRVGAAGGAYGTFQALWIATQQEGRWGIQFRHNLGFRPTPE